MNDDIPVWIEREGHRTALPGLRSPDDVAAAVAALEGERDVTLEIQPRGFADRVLIAVDGANAFVGLFDPDDWASQFRRHDFKDGPRAAMTIGGQTSHIDRPYLLDVALAARVVGEWLTSTEPTEGRWERQ